MYIYIYTCLYIYIYICLYIYIYIWVAIERKKSIVALSAAEGAQLPLRYLPSFNFSLHMCIFTARVNPLCGICRSKL